MKYFAYGSNMSEEVMRKVCPTYQIIGVSKLNDYRIAFTRKSVKTGSGVADVVSCPGLSVWGILYEIDEKGLMALDKKEGNGKAYNRIPIDVRTRENGITHSAITYTVIDKETEEIVPSDEYFDKIIDGAVSHDFPKHYLSFLESIKTEDKKNFRRGFLAKSTKNRQEAKGMPLIKISPLLKSQYPASRLCAVSYRNKTCVAKVVYDRNIPQDSCELDQSIRTGLGFPGRCPYGNFVQLHVLENKVSSFPLFHPRMVILPLYRPSVNDSEKQICVLCEGNIRLLGIEPGDYLRIRAVTKDQYGKLRLTEIKRRVFTGSIDSVLRDNQERDYPVPKEFYLDLDGRLQLNVDKEDIGFPVLLSADLKKLFFGRLLYYGLTLFLGLLALPPIIKELASLLDVSPTYGFVGGFILAILASLFLTVFDLKTKIQY